MFTVGRPVTTECVMGHPRSAANTRRAANGAQVCTICARRAAREYRARQQQVRQNLSGTIALITWRWNRHDPTPRPSWLWFATRERAAAVAPRDGWPFTIVDAARRPWVRYPERPNERHADSRCGA